MNNTLDIKRFGKILKHDGINFFPNMGLTLAILLAIPVIIWLFVSLMPHHNGDVIDSFSRINTISFITTIAIILAPARLYKNCNDPRKGIGYAMLPASTLEKFLSMVFYCVIVTPIIYLVGALAVDSILAIFKGPYEGYALTLYFDKYAQLKHVIQENNIYFEDPDSLPMLFKSLSPTFMVILSLLGSLTTSSVFMFSNMVFKKHKTSKMIGILIIISILFMIVLINYIAHHDTILMDMNEDNIVDVTKYIIHIMMNIAFYTNLIISAVLLWSVYRKIKTQKY